jgi:hypothetical protein
MYREKKKRRKENIQVLFSYIVVAFSSKGGSKLRNGLYNDKPRLEWGAI